MRIVPAWEVPAPALAALAEELVRAFGHAYPAWTVTEAVGELAHRDGLPHSVVAVGDDGTPLGCASLLADDEVDGLEGVGPWLGNVWVAPAARGRGVGGALVDAVVVAASAGGHHQLHLVTDSAVAWYRRQGWQEVGPAQAHGHGMTHLRLPLTPSKREDQGIAGIR